MANHLNLGAIANQLIENDMIFVFACPFSFAICFFNNDYYYDDHYQ